MNRQVFVLLCLWLISVSLSGLETRGFTYELDYSFWSNYYPDQNDKHFCYNDLLDLRAGLSTRNSKVDSIWCIIGFINHEYGKTVRLDRSGFSLFYQDYTIGYKYLRETGIGNCSQIYSQVLNNKYNRQPYVLSYNYSGIFISHTKGELNRELHLGGNEFNGMLAGYHLRFSHRQMEQHVNLLLMGRDSWYQQEMLSLNYESYLRNSSLIFSAAWSGQFLGKVEKKTRVEMQNICFLELIVPLNGWLMAGFNTRRRFYRHSQKESQIGTYLQLSRNSHSLNFVYDLTEWSKDNRIRRLDTVYWWQIKPWLKTGIVSRVYIPQQSSEFFEAGLQLSLTK